MRRSAGIVGWALATLFFAGAVLLGAAGDSIRLASIGTGVVLLSLASIGAILVTRRPDNRVAWLLLVIGLLGSVNAFGQALAVYLSTSTDASLGLSQTVLAISGYAFTLALSTLVLLFLVFPNGSLVSPRWRLGVWLAGGAALIAVVMITLLSRSVIDVGGFVLSVWSPEHTGGAVPESVSVLMVVSALATLSAFAAGSVSLLVRLRTSNSDERQQVKWVVYSGAISAGLMVMFFVSWVNQPELQWLIGLMVVSSPAAGFAVALFRYRLYEIDRLINRTIVYSAVVALLVAVYAFGVFLLRELLPVEGDLAVAASTLAVAALFNPLRKWVQQFVDRRFYRSRYDAQRVVEEFSHRLAGEIDLKALTEDWLATVDQAVKPETAGVWLRS